MTVVFGVVSRMPTISTSSLTLTMPRSMRPVTTVPRPVIVKTSSTGMRNGLSVSRSGVGMDSSTASMSSRIDSPHFSSPFERREGRHAHDGDVVAGELVLGEQLAHLELDELEDLLVVDHVALVQRDDDATGTPTWRASSTCSLVCGIGPSVAATTRIAPSIWAAPVIMFLM